MTAPQRPTDRLPAVLLLFALLGASCTARETAETQPTTTLIESVPSTTSTTEAPPEERDTLEALADAVVSSQDRGAVFIGVGFPEGQEAAAQGDDGEGRPVEIDLPWEAASVAKMIVATAVLQLVDDGVVDLDAPAHRYVDFDVPEGITVRDVMRHGSGIANLTDHLDSCPSLATLERMKSAASSATGPTEPGEYSNTNYLLLGYLVSQISGRDIGEYAQDNIFTPLGMDSTYWWESQDGPEPYWPKPMSHPGPVSPFTCSTVGQTVGTEGLTFVTSLEDMDRFLRGLFGGHLVSETSFSEMVPADDSEVGLGLWALDSEADDVRLYGHFGARSDFSVQVFYHPATERSIVVYGTGVDTESLLWEAWDWAWRTEERVDVED